MRGSCASRPDNSSALRADCDRSSQRTRRPTLYRCNVVMLFPEGFDRLIGSNEDLPAHENIPLVSTALSVRLSSVCYITRQVFITDTAARFIVARQRPRSILQAVKVKSKDVVFRDVHYVVVRPSVVCHLCLSVTFVHPTQAIENFGNVSTPFGYL